MILNRKDHDFSIGICNQQFQAPGNYSLGVLLSTIKYMVLNGNTMVFSSDLFHQQFQGRLFVLIFGLTSRVVLHEFVVDLFWKSHPQSFLFGPWVLERFFSVARVVTTESLGIQVQGGLHFYQKKWVDSYLDLEKDPVFKWIRELWWFNHLFKMIAMIWFVI